MFWMQLLGLIGAGLLIWFLYQQIRNNPQIFSWANINNSLFTMGILALVLIVFIAACILLLRTG